jgi:acetyl esterase
MPGTLSIDGDLFKEAAISADTIAFNRQLVETLKTIPAANTQPPSQTRADREAGRSVTGPIVLSDMAIPRVIHGQTQDVPVRVFVPDEVKGVYLHIHGGGWVLGRAHHADQRNEAIARNLHVAVVSVDYRLAPEDPYPAGPDDCETVAFWLAERARSEFGSDRLIIGGDSAGAHLSVVTLLRMRDRHGFRGFAGANLIYGMYDFTLTPSAANFGDPGLPLPTPVIRWFVEQYVPADRYRDPDVSPLFADLSGLPPALFTVGTLDPLLDDSLFMASRWLAAGNQAELAIYPGGVHGFVGYAYPLADQANQRIDEFIRQIVD